MCGSRVWPTELRATVLAMFQHTLIPLLLLAAAVPACDDPGQALDVDSIAPLKLAPGLALAGPELPDSDDDVRLREEGPPELWAVTTWGGQTIGVGQFVTIVVGCLNANPPVKWTCSLSARQPDTTKPERVGGLGCSAWWSPDYYKCQLNAFVEQGAVKLQ